MSSINASQRIDVLLALALTRAATDMRAAQEERAEPPGEDEKDAPEKAAQVLRAALGLLSETGPIDRRALESRAESYARLSRAQQSDWLARTLRRARPNEKDAQLDEQIHPSHIIEALREEPGRIRALLLLELPAPLAEQSAASLNIPLPLKQQGGRSKAAGVNAALLRLIRQAFLSRFVRLNELSNPTPLDMLSGVELRRLVKFLGAREIAYACRHLPVEDVSLFLRRFSAEDARMITAHISAARAPIITQRAAFVERLMDAAMSLETAPEAMLNHIGLKLLAMTMAESSPARVRYTAQKIPLEASTGLSQLIAESRATEDTEMIRSIAAEAEALAASLLQTQLRGPA